MKTMQPRPQTFVFADPATVSVAVDLLMECGIRATRITIHRWGTGIAVRALDPVEGVWLDRLVAMGAMVSSVWADVQPAGPLDLMRTRTV